MIVHGLTHHYEDGGNTFYMFQHAKDVERVAELYNTLRDSQLDYYTTDEFEVLDAEAAQLMIHRLEDLHRETLEEEAIDAW